jgi:nitrogen fixation/metabolism regulation signal transduction histidine kinase
MIRHYSCETGFFGEKERRIMGLQIAECGFGILAAGDLAADKATAIVAVAVVVLTGVIVLVIATILARWIFRIDEMIRYQKRTAELLERIDRRLSTERGSGPTQTP